MTANRGIIAPFLSWPLPDQEAWRKAMTPSRSLFDSGAAAKKFRPTTIASREKAYSYWIGFLSRIGELRADISGIALITPERLDDYVDDQRARGNRNTSITTRLVGLHAAARLMQPDTDLRFVLRPGGRSLSRALPATARTVEIHDPREITARALALYREGLTGKGYGKGSFALRDAALLSLFAERAPRLGSVAKMDIGRSLERRDGTYWVKFEDDDMKTGDRLGYPLPDAMTPIVDTYVNTVRPGMGGHHTTAVWMGSGGNPLTDADISNIVRRRTRQWFGHARGHGPNRLRKSLTTMVALEAPDLILDVCAVLGHSQAMSLAHYNKAKATMAGERHEQRVSTLKDRLRLLAKRSFGWDS